MVTQAQLDHFRPRAVWAMGKLMADFPVLGLEDVAAIMGNLGHESLGLTVLQEIKPVVKGSRGGYGWPQWTASRRVAYEAYCARNNLDPASDKANYAWLFIELRGSESKAIEAVTSANGLYNKVVAFEKAYERAGHKAYASRMRWAEIARDVWNEAHKPTDVPDPVEEPDVPVVLPDRPEIAEPEGLSDGLSKHAEYSAKLHARELILALRAENARRAAAAPSALVRLDPSWPLPPNSISHDEPSPRIIQPSGEFTMPDLNGMKTYIVAFLVIAIAICEGVLGIDIPGAEMQDNWVEYVLGGAGIGTFRHAIAKLIGALVR